LKTGFIDKLIERLGRVRPEEARAHLLRVVREKGFLETIFNAIQEGILVTDSRGALLYLNDAACEFFGLEGDESVGRPLAERVRGLDWDALTAGLETGKFVSRDMEVFYPANRFLNFYVVPLSLEDASETAADRRTRNQSRSDRVGYAMIVRDITESRRSAQTTIENERLSALTMLAAGVAHEIGNPLNSLDIHLQLMERKLRRLPPAQRDDLDESVRVAREEIRRLDFIVSQFLRAIRPAPLSTQPADINAVVEESISFLAAEIANRDILVEQELDRRLPLLEIDRDQMKQAFYNIIRNSFQAMQTGGILRISTFAEADYVAVTFADTGGGIAPENLSKVFDPYFTTKSTGNGLGLLIVRRIVREHGGEIELRSDTGRGLAVTVRLPHGDRRARMLEFGGDDDSAAVNPAHANDDNPD
jgi:two-component system, sporulation sensor kinase E